MTVEALGLDELVALYHSDPAFRLAAGYVADHAVPWSLYMGDRGTPAPGDPSWLDVDRLVVDAVLIARGQLCGMCGTREEEWAFRDEDGKLVAYPDQPYEATTTTCFGCRQLELARADIRPSAKGVRAVLRRVRGFVVPDRLSDG